MARATYQDLIREVRSVLAVTEDQAWAWLLDRSRVLNAETGWLFTTGVAFPAGDPDGRYYLLDEGIIALEAVIVDGQPYQRSTLHAMDARWTGDTGNTCGIYAPGANQENFQIHPPTTSPDVGIRSVQDVEDNRALVPPFPSDFDQSLIDGAVAIGLARMDERFDSASYFDQRFATAVDRLRRRRHARIGRGATAIRVAL